MTKEKKEIKNEEKATKIINALLSHNSTHYWWRRSKTFNLFNQLPTKAF